MKLCKACGMVFRNREIYSKKNVCPVCSSEESLLNYYNEDDVNEIVTHNGKFHTDDLFSCAIVKIIFPTAKIIRTRDDELTKPKNKRMLIDVGLEYDPGKMQYDHHQFKKMRKVPCQANLIRYSSLGLIWEEFGYQVIYHVAKTNKMTTVERQVDSLYDLILKRIVVPIDLADTIGVGGNNKIKNNQLSFQFVISSFNSSQNLDDKFKLLIDFIKEFMIMYIIDNLKNATLEESYNVDFDAALIDKRNYVILAKPGAWIRYFNSNREKYKSIDFVIFEDSAVGKIKLQSVPMDNNTRSVKIKIPAILSTEPGVSFIHPSGFICECDNIESAIKVAKLSKQYYEINKL